jgi:maltose O-acetyltransferase
MMEMSWLYQQLRKLYHKMREDPVQALLDRGLRVGCNFCMMEEVKIDHSHCWHIVIGDDVTLAPRVHILAHDASTKLDLGYTRIGKVAIGSRVFVGASATILPGVTIGDDVVVGAGSVVTRDIAAGQVVAGNPAVVVCSKQEYLQRRKLEMNQGPSFDSRYTLSAGVDEVMKLEMNERMTRRIGYVE